MTHQPSTHWNAEVYDRIGVPMRRWARDVIWDLNLGGDETVLDAGCGSGSVTFDLLEELPRGKIYAVDSSGEMIAKISRSINERGVANVVPIHADLTDFMLPEQVDVVFSNAVFHWIPDDDALFSSLYRATKPGGRLRAQCGGVGNIVRLTAATHEVERREPFSRYLDGASEFRKYRTPAQAKEAMERVGWTDVRGTVFEAPVRFDSHDDAALYLRTVILQLQVARLPEELASVFSGTSSLSASARLAHPSSSTMSGWTSGPPVQPAATIDRSRGRPLMFPVKRPIWNERMGGSIRSCRAKIQGTLRRTATATLASPPCAKPS